MVVEGPRGARIVTYSTAPAIPNLGLRSLVSAADSGGAYALQRGSLPPGDEVPLHRHRPTQETFYLLDGELTFALGDREAVLRPGQAVVVPAGGLHGYRTTSPTPADVLIVLAPGEFEDYLKGVDALVQRYGAEVPADLRRALDERFEVEWLVHDQRS